MLGVSTERGAVHAVALTNTGARLADRIVAHRTVAVGERGYPTAGIVTALEHLAADIAPRQPVAVAVAYHDAAERRALVTGLAAGRWHAASLVSTRAAHLNVAGAMTWLSEFDDLLLCDVVPGRLTLTLVDKGRGRVLAGVSRTGGMDSAALGATMIAACDQFDAAETRPDAVVLIGSAAGEPAVADAVRAIGAPVLPCAVAALAPALGAALAVLPRAGGVTEAPVPRPRPHRTAALLASAALAAGFTVAGGAYLMGEERPPAAPVAAGAFVVPPAPPAAELPVGVPISAAEHAPAGAASLPPVARSPWVPAPWRTTAGEPLPLVPAQAPDPAAPDPAAPGAAGPDTAPAVTGSGTPSGAGPGATLLFPGEAPPPGPFGPEAAAWWDSHLRLTLAWVTRELLPR